MLDPFYPVVPDSGWVARLVPAGARLIQLRIKDQPAAEIRRQIKEAKAVCAGARARSSSSTITGRRRSTRAATSSISARKIFWTPT